MVVHMRSAFRVVKDGNNVVRYFIDGTQVDPDFYIARFFEDYGAVPTDPLITETTRQEADNAGTSREEERNHTNVFQDIMTWDANNPAPAAVPALDDRILH